MVIAEALALTTRAKEPGKVALAIFRAAAIVKGIVGKRLTYRTVWWRRTPSVNLASGVLAPMQSVS